MHHFEARRQKGRTTVVRQMSRHAIRRTDRIGLLLLCDAWPESAAQVWETSHTFRHSCSVTIMDHKLFEELNEKIRAVIAQSPAADLEKNMRAMLAAMFNRLDLVTREEFDAQREVLARTREKVTQLEARLAELESRDRS